MRGFHIWAAGLMFVIAALGQRVLVADDTAAMTAKLAGTWNAHVDLDADKMTAELKRKKVAADQMQAELAKYRKLLAPMKVAAVFRADGTFAVVVSGMTEQPRVRIMKWQIVETKGITIKIKLTADGKSEMCEVKGLATAHCVINLPDDLAGPMKSELLYDKGKDISVAGLKDAAPAPAAGPTTRPFNPLTVKLQPADESLTAFAKKLAEKVNKVEQDRLRRKDLPQVSLQTDVTLSRAGRVSDTLDRVDLSVVEDRIAVHGGDNPNVTSAIAIILSRHGPHFAVEKAVQHVQIVDGKIPDGRDSSPVDVTARMSRVVGILEGTLPADTQVDIAADDPQDKPIDGPVSDELKKLAADVAKMLASIESQAGNEEPTQISMTGRVAKVSRTAAGARIIVAMSRMMMVDGTPENIQYGGNVILRKGKDGAWTCVRADVRTDSASSREGPMDGVARAVVDRSAALQKMIDAKK